ncbi:MAG: hypothetical protein D4S02_01765 [Rhodocyclaceae bacterium]|nr:MAG: hypothetical protein D4S02_01765 [Rhodocyclaceae bacterium]
MVDAFAQVCPPPARMGKQPIPQKKVGESLDVLYQQVTKYVMDKRLGFLGRARLAKALQDEMWRHEYPNELVSRVVNAVTMNALVPPDRR